MPYGQFLAKGAGEDTPPFWITTTLIVTVGVAFPGSKARKR
ncbi:hypothetical protein SUDANB58_05933 (plasmid) [Streptomyces sp. enrichment culture]